MTVHGALLRILVLLAAIFSGAQSSAAADISDTRRLLYVADRSASVIDVIDPRDGNRLERLETAYPVGRLIITPHAPLLLYTSPGEARLFAYNLQKREWLAPLTLPFVPEHVVLDPGGSKLGITSSTHGGFVLVSAYRQELLLHLPAVPPTGPVLFDPNDIDIYYTSDASGSLGLIDSNLGRHEELPLAAGPADLSAPSRSLDGRYLYVTNHSSGEVYNLNAFTRLIHRTFDAGQAAVRPYTTPEGLFLYVLDSASGHWAAYDQNRFSLYAEATFPVGTDQVAVGRQDRMNVFASTTGKSYYLYDNAGRHISGQGTFAGTPLEMHGSVDGLTAIVAFSDLAQIALLDLESGEVRYLDATDNGAGALGLGMTNNVCH